ncbi:hypothetical protein JW905_08850 [bacterium]|nr:hypothetical protein [candidate division CSSED10-310 bacterium]
MKNGLVALSLLTWCLSNVLCAPAMAVVMEADQSGAVSVCWVIGESPGLTDVRLEGAVLHASGKSAADYTVLTRMPAGSSGLTLAGNDLPDADLVMLRLVDAQTGAVLARGARLRFEHPRTLLPLPVVPAARTIGELLAVLNLEGQEVFAYGQPAPLSLDSHIPVGGILRLAEPVAGPLYLAGILCEEPLYFTGGRAGAMVWPLDAAEVPVGELFEEDSMPSGAVLYDDGNAAPMTSITSLIPGRAYLFRPAAGMEIDPWRGTCRYFGSGAPVPARNERMPEPRGGDRDNDVRVMYREEYRTAHYKCWENGWSGPWDGLTDSYPGCEQVVNAAVVRRGAMVYVSDTGISAATGVAVYSPALPDMPRVQVDFTVGWDAETTCATIQIPAAAPAGDYRVRIGDQPENFCTLYVIFNTYLFTESSGGPFDSNEMRSWGYEDTVYTGENRDGYGVSYDYGNFQYWGPWGSSSPGVDLSGYRGATDDEAGRNGGVYGQRFMEIFGSIHGAGAITPMEAAVNCYQVTGQRITWTYDPYWGYDAGSWNHHDKILAGQTVYSMNGYAYSAAELDAKTAEVAAQGRGFNGRLPSGMVYDCGQCMCFGAFQTAALRSIGIPSRCHYAMSGAGWLASFHVWADAAFLDEPASPISWGGEWFKMDSCDVYAGAGYAHFEGQVAPLVMDGFADYMFNTHDNRAGPNYRGRWDWNDSSYGSGGACHADTMLVEAPETDPQGSYLWFNVSGSTCPFRIYDSFADASGTGVPPLTYVVPGDHGYALNDLQHDQSGVGFNAAFGPDENLPGLQPGERVSGWVGGYGACLYRIEPSEHGSLQLVVETGDDQVRLYGRWWQAISSTGSRFAGMQYDLGPVTEVLIHPLNPQLFVLVQGETPDGQHFDSQEIVPFVLHLRYVTSPTPSITPTREPTLVPTASPTPSVSPTRTPAPGSPTATPAPGLTVQLALNRDHFAAGDPFRLNVLVNLVGPGREADQYLILDVYGVYWFWPEWTQDVAGRRVYFSMPLTSMPILSFEWPEGTGVAEGIAFWAALLEPAGTDCISLDHLVFSYGH